jgi:uncharacterized protein (DUF433 family)
MTTAELVDKIRRLSPTERLQLLELLRADLMPPADLDNLLSRTIVLDAGEPRLIGSRIGVHSVLAKYLDHGRSPEQIVARYPSLTLEQVYATILYYLRHREALDASLALWRAHAEQAAAEQARTPAFLDFQRRMREERARRAASTE